MNLYKMTLEKCAFSAGFVKPRKDHMRFDTDEMPSTQSPTVSTKSGRTCGYADPHLPRVCRLAHFAFSLPGCTSHTFTVWSLEALARRLPSGLKQTLLRRSVCPLRVRSSCPFSASYTFTVLSQPALA